MFRPIVTAVLLMLLLAGNLVAGGICLSIGASSSSHTSHHQGLSKDEDCTCRLSSADRELASNTEWSPAILPVVRVTPQVQTTTPIVTCTSNIESFQPSIPSLPPKTLNM